MMAKNSKNKQAEQKVQRYLTIAKIFLAMTPCIAYLYISLMASMLSMSMQELLESMPSVTIIFLVAMINAYVAYLLHVMQNKLLQGKTEIVCINMILLFIAQLIIGNVIFAFMFAWILYVIVTTYQINIKQILKQKMLKKVVTDGGGSLVVLFFSSISLFATIRIM